MSLRLKAVTFDCWGTLIADRGMAAAEAVRASVIVEAAAGKLSVELAGELATRAWQEHNAAWGRGEQFGSPGMARFIAAELRLADALVEHLTAAFEEASLHGDVEPLPGAGDTLDALRSAGIPTALVCDTGFTPGRIVRRFLDDFGLHLDVLAFSNEVGVPKPHARIFLHALEALGVEPSEAAHVGDLLRTDVAGARAVGMRTVRITATNPTGTAVRSVDTATRPLAAGVTGADLPEADELVASHAELLPALRRLGLADNWRLGLADN